MTTDLDHAVRTVLADIIATAPTADRSQHGVSVVDAAPAPKAPRRLMLAAAACLVVAGLIGGGIALRARRATPTNGETSSTSLAPATTIANGSGPPLLPINALLPVSLPSGFSVLQADTDTSNAGQRYTVWSSCDSCSEPTAAVALVREGNDPLATEQPDRDHQDVTIRGRTARYYPATNAQPEMSLVSTDGREPGFLFNGWGIDLATLEDLAGGVIDGQDVPTHTGLVTVFDGEAGGLSPGLVNTDAQLQVTYVNPASGATVVYMYAHSTTSVDLAFQLWTQPFAKFATVQGHRAITSAYGPFSKLAMQPDGNTLIVLLAQSAGVTLSDLTSIEFTMATPSDPRWAQMQQQLRQAAANDVFPCSRSGDTVSVPNVAGMVGDEAVAFLTAAGLRPQQHQEALPNGVAASAHDFVVVGQGLDPGARVVCGSTIGVSIAFQPGPLHVVRAGDTYASIAAEAGLTVEQLLDFNGLTKLAANGTLAGDPPRLGQTLRLTKPVPRG